MGYFAPSGIFIEDDSMNIENEILNGIKSFPIDKKAGIYLLCQDKEIVYIGQSQNLGQRIYAHVTEDEKRFNRVAVRECGHLSQSSLSDLEASLIIKLKPIYNGSIPPNNKYKTMGQLKKILKTTAWKIKRWIKDHNIQLVGLDHYRLEDFEGINNENTG